jgi:tellurite resistance protein TerC
LESVGSPALWAGFIGAVLAMLALDLGVFHRDAHTVRFREALSWSIVWVVLSLAFAGWVYAQFGSERGLEFLTGYVIEKALSVDNIFVFLVLFSTFKVPPAYQHRVLFWGILGALVMRAAFILLGAALVQRFHFVLYLFGLILVVTGIRLMVKGDEDVHPEANPIFKLFRRFVPAVSEYDGQRFLTVRDGRRYATPLLLVLVAIETADVVFAVDSIPAVFAVTQDPFIVFTSNIFAILGLRAMYFLLAGVIEKFQDLRFGLALVLIFVGVKMLIADVFKIPIAVSLVVVFALIAGSVLVSIWRQRGSAPPEGQPIPPAKS